MRTRSVSVPALCAAVLLVACGGETGSSTTTTTSVGTTTSLAVTTTGLDTTTTLGATSTSATSTTTPGTTTTSSSGELPGDPIEFGPAEGDIVAVIGVAHDDVLNLRSAPGADQPIIDGIPPLYDSLVALGHTRDLPRSFWIEVDYQGTTGWVNYSYIAFLGDTIDATASVVEHLGETPSAETMLELGVIVAETMASEEPESDIVLTVAPEVGDLGEITYDVVGLGDDAVRGVRVHVFAQPIDEAFVLHSVEMTSLCGRGVDDGACV